MRTHEVEYSTKALSHLTHITQLAKRASNDGITRLMNALEAPDPINGHRRQQGSRTSNLKSIIKHVDLNSTTFNRVVTVCDCISECLSTRILWIANLFLKAPIWTKAGFNQVGPNLFPGLCKQLKDAANDMCVIDNVVIAAGA